MPLRKNVERGFKLGKSRERVREGEKRREVKIENEPQKPTCQVDQKEKKKDVREKKERYGKDKRGEERKNDRCLEGKR